MFRYKFACMDGCMFALMPRCVPTPQRQRSCPDTSLCRSPALPRPVHGSSSLFRHNTPTKCVGVRDLQYGHRLHSVRASKLCVCVCWGREGRGNSCLYLSVFPSIYVFSGARNTHSLTHMHSGTCAGGIWPVRSWWIRASASCLAVSSTTSPMTVHIRCTGSTL